MAGGLPNCGPLTEERTRALQSQNRINNAIYIATRMEQNIILLLEWTEKDKDIFYMESEKRMKQMNYSQNKQTRQI